MIANWMERTLILSPEKDADEQALKALAAACAPMIWDAAPPPSGLAQGSGATAATPASQRPR